MTVFKLYLVQTHDSSNYKSYEEAVNAYSQQQDDAHFQKMMKAQEAMDQK